MGFGSFLGFNSTYAGVDYLSTGHCNFFNLLDLLACVSGVACVLVLLRFVILTCGVRGMWEILYQSNCKNYLRIAAIMNCVHSPQSKSRAASRRARTTPVRLVYASATKS